MFDIGFSEILVIAIVALIVLGPERMPKAARFAGLWVRRARAQWYSVKSELERELAADELKRSLRDTETAMREIDAGVRAIDGDAQREFQAMREATRATAFANGAPAAPVAVTPSDHRDDEDHVPPEAGDDAPRT
jgi:sec-independent protein translocase protein TatB